MCRQNCLSAAASFSITAQLTQAGDAQNRTYRNVVVDPEEVMPTRPTDWNGPAELALGSIAGTRASVLLCNRLQRSDTFLEKNDAQYARLVSMHE